MINVYNPIENVETDQNDWWFVFDETSKNIIVEPQQCSGSTYGPYTMVVADTKEEIDQYIQDNGLILPPDPEDSFNDNIE